MALCGTTNKKKIYDPWNWGFVITVMYQMLRLKISNPEALIFTFYVFWRKIVAKLEFYEQVKITIEVFSLQ